MFIIILILVILQLLIHNIVILMDLFFFNKTALISRQNICFKQNIQLYLMIS